MLECLTFVILLPLAGLLPDPKQYKSNVQVSSGNYWSTRRVKERNGQRTTETLEDEEKSDVFSSEGGFRLWYPQLQGSWLVPGFGGQTFKVFTGIQN